ncbi:protein glass [Nephila pilipes]|uniref:Protein glass n=1 Tax=Nephila pilipes TaxID=299642 RepID=A0A8X6TZL3_NEPPI|nr:protein glass [Nephila pilipes]
MDGAPPSYLPNNPSFLQDPWKSPQSFSPITHAGFDDPPEDKSCEDPQDFECPRSPVDLNINSFSFSPVDMEPLTSLFSFSTCSSPYKDYSPFKEYKSHDTNDVYASMKHSLVHGNGSPVNGSLSSQSFGGQLSPLGPMSHNIYNQSITRREIVVNKLMEDVKHTGCLIALDNYFTSFRLAKDLLVSGLFSMGTVRPKSMDLPSMLNPNDKLQRDISIEPGICSPVSPSHPVTPQSVSASTIPYNAYPQIQVSGTGNVAGGGGVFYSGDFSASPASVQSHGAVFPAAMSVNLSMNMTMGVPSFGDHFVGTASSSVPANHFQWTTSHVPSASYTTNGTSPMVSNYGQPVQVQYNTPSPTHPASGTSGTYTFTAEFRPADSVSLPSVEREFSNCNSNLKAIPGSFYPCKHTSVTVPVETTQTGVPVMFKPKPRTIPTGRAACFPAGIPIDSPPISSPAPLDTEHVAMNEDSNSSGKMNLCRICGKTYARPSTLKTHMRTHSGERPYRCITCHKSFSQAANLTAHIRTHSGEKPFRCHVCDRRFSQSSSVTTHMRTHSGERPYRCWNRRDN